MSIVKEPRPTITNYYQCQCLPMSQHTTLAKPIMSHTLEWGDQLAKLPHIIDDERWLMIIMVNDCQYSCSHDLTWSWPMPTSSVPHVAKNKTALPCIPSNRGNHLNTKVKKNIDAHLCVTHIYMYMQMLFMYACEHLADPARKPPIDIHSR